MAVTGPIGPQANIYSAQTEAYRDALVSYVAGISGLLNVPSNINLRTVFQGCIGKRLEEKVMEVAQQFFDSEAVFTVEEMEELPFVDQMDGRFPDDFLDDLRTSMVCRWLNEGEWERALDFLDKLPEMRIDLYDRVLEEGIKCCLVDANRVNEVIGLARRIQEKPVYLSALMQAMMRSERWDWAVNFGQILCDDGSLGSKEEFEILASLYRNKSIDDAIVYASETFTGMMLKFALFYIDVPGYIALMYQRKGEFDEPMHLMPESVLTYKYIGPRICSMIMKRACQLKDYDFAFKAAALDPHGDVQYLFCQLVAQLTKGDDKAKREWLKIHITDEENRVKLALLLL